MRAPAGAFVAWPDRLLAAGAREGFAARDVLRHHSKQRRFTGSAFALAVAFAFAVAVTRQPVARA